MSQWLEWLETPVEEESADGEGVREAVLKLARTEGKPKKLRDKDVLAALEALVDEWTGPEK